jgi:hypothetical protein
MAEHWLRSVRPLLADRCDTADSNDRWLCCVGAGAVVVRRSRYPAHKALRLAGYRLFRVEVWT